MPLLLNYILTYVVFLLITIFTGCAQPNVIQQTYLGPEKEERKLEISGQYAQSEGNTGNSQGINSLSLNADCSAKGGSSGNIIVSFNNAGVATSFVPSLNIVPNDTSCTITLLDITITNIKYKFTNLNLRGNNTQNPAWSTVARAIDANSGDVIYMSAKLDIYWSGIGGFNPKLQLIYGHNANILPLNANSNYTFVPLPSSAVYGTSIAAPNYCLGNNGKCDNTNTALSLAVFYDANFWIYQENLSITLAAGQQSAEDYKLLTLSSGKALIDKGVVDASLGSFTTADNSSCALLSSGAIDVRGCSYGAIDALYNTNIGVKISAGRGNLPGINSINSINTSVTIKNSIIETISANWSAASGIGAEFLGYSNSVAIPTVNAQQAIYYLILRHRDGALSDGSCTPSATVSCVSSYQLFVINFGHN